jgi:ELWxxDGT repeat protein
MSTPRLVADIYPGYNGSSVKNFRAVGSTLFFLATDGLTGLELWKSNGTAAGTKLVKDINPGGSSFADELTAVGDTLFFTALAPVSGSELWKSNGTSSGTKIVKDLWPELISSGTSTLTAVGNSLFFRATDGKNGGLWKSDGTSAGTKLVRANLGIASKSYDVGPPFAAAVKRTLFFSASDGSTGLELWRSNGTSAGTRLVREIRPGLLGSEPRELTSVGNTLFFTANDGKTGRELWKSDGTSKGTTRVKDILTGFSAGSPLSSEPQELTAVGNTLFFTVNDGITGRELWKSDGTSKGTTLVANIANPVVNGTSYPGDSSNPSGLTAVGNTLFFTADGGDKGVGLWKSDGTAAGTVFVSELVPSSSKELTAVGRTLFFPQSNDDKGLELWALDVTL